MRDYGKVFTAFWSSETARALSEDGRALALYLMTSPHTNMIGIFRLPDGYASEDLQWGLERVSKGFRNLEDNGFATRYEDTKWVVIAKHLEWNEIENPNQAKSAIKLLESVPDKIIEKSATARVLIDSCQRFSDKIPDNYLSRLETLSKPFRNQEQEQEQEQDILPTPADDPPPPPPPTKPKRKTRLPRDFILTDTLRQRAVKYWVERGRQDLDPVEEFEKFTNHHRGHGTTMLDWDAAWQTWYGNAIKFNPPPKGNNSTHPQEISGI